jgi:hypothetical protein
MARSVGREICLSCMDLSTAASFFSAWTVIPGRASRASDARGRESRSRYSRRVLARRSQFPKNGGKGFPTRTRSNFMRSAFTSDRKQSAARNAGIGDPTRSYAKDTVELCCLRMFLRGSWPISLVERIPCSVTVLIVDFIANNRKPLALTILWPAENASELLGPS